MKVLVTSKSFGRYAPEAIELLERNGVAVVRGSKSTMTAAEIAAEVGDADALIVGNDTVTEEVFAAASKLRVVHMNGTGLDGIDIAAATAHGVLVANAQGANRNAVAELTVGLMLVAARAIDRHIEILKSGRWERTAGCEVSGKTIGLLGLGNIGRRVVDLLKGFDVRVVGYDPAPNQEWVKAHEVQLAESMDTVFAEADFLILTLPLIPATRGLVDARRLALMKPTAFLINTARGGLIDDAAVSTAVREKKIAGAALDVFEPEPLAADSSLRGVAGITLTPHLAATSLETAANVSRIVAENVLKILIHHETAFAVNAREIASRDAGAH